MPSSRGGGGTDIRQVAIGSANRAKILAVRTVVLRVWPEALCVPVAVESGVSAMPMTDDEAVAGARQRATRALAALDADLGIGLEGSASERSEGLYLTGWVAIVDRAGRTGLASGARLLLPELLAARLRAGEELGPLIDFYSGERGTREQQGAMGYLTCGLLPRDASFAAAVACALAPFLRPGLYEQPDARSGG